MSSQFDSSTARLDVLPLPVGETDEDGRLAYVNKSFEEHMGKEASELVGLDLGEVLGFAPPPQSPERGSEWLKTGRGPVRMDWVRRGAVVLFVLHSGQPNVTADGVAGGQSPNGETQSSPPDSKGDVRPDSRPPVTRPERMVQRSLVQALRSVRTAERTLRSAIQLGREDETLLADLDDVDEAPPETALAWPKADGAISAREAEILRAMLEGRSVLHVAEKLELSVHTVRNHLKSIYRKLGVHSREELFAAFLPRIESLRVPGSAAPAAADAEPESDA